MMIDERSRLGYSLQKGPVVDAQASPTANSEVLSLLTLPRRTMCLPRIDDPDGIGGWRPAARLSALGI